MNSLRISGIYDLKTLFILQEQGIKHFGFDLRPTSYNFIQTHILEECLLKTKQKDSIYLHFENEKDFVLDAFIERLSMHLFAGKSITLEVSDVLPPSHYSAYKLPILWHYKNEEMLHEYLRDPCLAAVSFKAFELTSIPHLSKILSELKRRNIKVEISKKWGQENIFLHNIPKDLSHFKIDEFISSNYRDIDHEKLVKGIHENIVI